MPHGYEVVMHHWGNRILLHSAFRNVYSGFTLHIWLVLSVGNALQTK